MRVIQNIGDLILLALLSPAWVWITLFGVVFLGGAFVLATREAVSTEEGRRKWQDFVHSKLGKKKLALASIFSIIVVGSIFSFITSGSHGHCSLDGRHHSDEEFIRAALKGNMGLLTFPEVVSDPAQKDRIITEFLAKNPDCCKVFRDWYSELWSSELGDLSWFTWNNNVVVRIRNEKSLKAYRRGEKVLLDEGLYYATVDNCLQGTHAIIELIPGG